MAKSKMNRCSRCYFGKEGGCRLYSLLKDVMSLPKEGDARWLACQQQLEKEGVEIVKTKGEVK